MDQSKAAYELAVAQAIDRLNDQRGVSRSDIARVLGIAELEATRLENASEALSAGGLMLLLTFYGIDLADFVERVEAELPRARSRLDRAAHAQRS